MAMITLTKHARMKLMELWEPARVRYIDTVAVAKSPMINRGTERDLFKLIA